MGFKGLNTVGFFCPSIPLDNSEIHQNRAIKFLRSLNHTVVLVLRGFGEFLCSPASLWSLLLCSYYVNGLWSHRKDAYPIHVSSTSMSTPLMIWDREGDLFVFKCLSVLQTMCAKRLVHRCQGLWWTSLCIFVGATNAWFMTTGVISGSQLHMLSHQMGDWYRERWIVDEILREVLTKSLLLGKAIKLHVDNVVHSAPGDEWA